MTESTIVETESIQVEPDPTEFVDYLKVKQTAYGYFVTKNDDPGIPPLHPKFKHQYVFMMEMRRMLYKQFGFDNIRLRRSAKSTPTLKCLVLVVKDEIIYDPKLIFRNPYDDLIRGEPIMLMSIPFQAKYTVANVSNKNKYGKKNGSKTTLAGSSSEDVSEPSSTETPDEQHT